MRSPGGCTMVVPPSELPEKLAAADTKRVRLVLVGLFLLAVIAALVVWGLVR